MFIENASQAISALVEHRLRTTLSILGIMIGIAAVMAVSTISKGGNHLIYSELETFGLRSVWIYRNRNPDTPNGQQERPGSGIDLHDIRALEEQSTSLGIRRLSALSWARDEHRSVTRQGKIFDADVIGVGRDYPSIVNDTIIAGRRFISADIDGAKPYALVGSNVIKSLFDKPEEAIGAEIRLGNQRVIVIGLLKDKSRDFLSSIGSVGGRGTNDRVLIPYTLMHRLKNSHYVDSLQLEADSADTSNQVGLSVTEILQVRHRGEFSYQHETMEQYIGTADRILNGVATIGVIAASVSLLVAGMGIMNMMGTSVLERTREIGVRKALGARQQDILWQFLLEAILIGVAGGTLGLVIGSLASVGLAQLTGFPLIPSYHLVASALVGSVLIGLLAGLLPARRAARLTPVDALRVD